MEVGHFNHPPFGGGPRDQLPLTSSWEEKKPFSSFISTPPRSFSNRISPPPTECVSPDCPVKERHHMFEYWHNGKQPHREDWEVFHGSNPPGNVWRSYNRLQCHRGCGAMADIERVRQFRRHHGCCCCSRCCKSSSSSADDDDDDNLDIQCRRWTRQEKLWEIGILPEEGGGEAEKGMMIPPLERSTWKKKKQEEGTTEHNHHQHHHPDKKKERVTLLPTRTVDYLQRGDKSSYHEHRMRVLKYRQRQKDKRREKSFAY